MKRKLIIGFVFIRLLNTISYSEVGEQNKVQQEITNLAAQNGDLLQSLKAQITLFEEQQALIESLSERVKELEGNQTVEPIAVATDSFQETNTSKSPNQSEMEAFEAEFGRMEVADEEFKPSINFGGWLGFLYSDDDRESTNAGFDAHPLYLYTEAHPSEDWSVFAEVEIEHLFKSSSSGTKGEMKVERLYLEHEFADSSKIRGGKFFLPFGYWYNLHWHFLTETLSRPMTFNNSYVPKQQVGLEYINTGTINGINLNYYAWLADGPDVFATNNRTESDFSFGAAIFAEKQVSDTLTLGATAAFHQQKVERDTQQNAVFGLTLTNKLLELRSEYYFHEREIDDDLETGYISAKLKTADAFGFVFRHDFGDDRKTSGDASNPSTTSNSIGFMWQPKPHLLLKGEFRVNEFKSNQANDNYNSWNLFSAVKF